MAAKVKQDPSWPEFVNLFRLRDGTLEMNEERIRAQYEELRHLAKGGKIEVFRGDIRIPLGFVWWNKIVPLGSFVLVIRTHWWNIRLMSDSVLRNAVQSFTSFNTADGSVCFGNISGGIRELVEKKQYTLAALLAKRFLQSASPD